MIRILERRRKRVKKNRHRFVEGHSVLQLVRQGLFSVPLELQVEISSFLTIGYRLRSRLSTSPGEDRRPIAGGSGTRSRPLPSPLRREAQVAAVGILAQVAAGARGALFRTEIADALFELAVGVARLSFSERIGAEIPLRAVEIGVARRRVNRGDPHRGRARDRVAVAVGDSKRHVVRPVAGKCPRQFQAREVTVGLHERLVPDLPRVLQRKQAQPRDLLRDRVRRGARAGAQAARRTVGIGRTGERFPRRVVHGVAGERGIHCHDCQMIVARADVFWRHRETRHGLVAAFGAAGREQGSKRGRQKRENEIDAGSHADLIPELGPPGKTGQKPAPPKGGGLSIHRSSGT